jgi:hypothetical protein
MKNYFIPFLLLVIIGLQCFIIYQGYSRPKLPEGFEALGNGIEDGFQLANPGIPNGASQVSPFSALANSIFPDFDDLMGTPEEQEQRQLEVDSIPLPGPTESEVRQFLEKLNEIAGRRKVYIHPSPLTDALRKLHSADLPIMLEYLDEPLGNYLVFVLPHLVTQDQKELVLTAFIEQPGLKGVIVKQGWAPDCARTVTQHLRQANEVSKSEWTEIGLATRNQETYHALMDAYFEVSSIFEDDREEIYNEIVIAEDFPLSEFHDRLWDVDGASGAITDQDDAALAKRCIHYGSVNALLAAAQTLETRDPGKLAPQQAQLLWIGLEEMILKVICTGESLEDKLAWIKQSRNKLHFDKTSNCFTIAE